MSSPFGKMNFTRQTSRAPGHGEPRRAAINFLDFIPRIYPTAVALLMPAARPYQNSAFTWGHSFSAECIAQRWKAPSRAEKLAFAWPVGAGLDA